MRARDFDSAMQGVKQLVQHTAYPFRVTSDWERERDSLPLSVRYEGVDGEEGVLALHDTLSWHLTLSLARNAACKLYESVSPFVSVLDPTVQLSVHKDWSTVDGGKLKDGRLVSRDHRGR